MLSLFEWIFSWAIGFHLLYDRPYLIGDYASADPLIQWMAYAPYFTLVVLCFVAPWMPRFRFWFYIVIAACYFLVFKRMLLLKTPMNGLYGTWNHALSFWIFISLAFRTYWGDRRVRFAIKFLLVISYFSAGLAKLGQNPEWTNGYTLQYYFLGRTVHTGAPPFWWVLKDLTFAKALSFGVLAMELLSPLALLHRRAEYMFVVVTLMFQATAWYFMDLAWMKYFGWAYLIFILDWCYSSESSQGLRPAIEPSQK